MADMGKLVGKTVIVLAILGVAGIAIVGMTEDSDRSSRASDSGKERPDTAAGRRGFVEIMTNKNRGSMRTEGVMDEGLVLNVSGCTVRALHDMVTAMTDRLIQFDFEWVRCEGSSSKVTRPWK